MICPPRQSPHPPLMQSVQKYSNTCCQLFLIFCWESQSSYSQMHWFPSSIWTWDSGLELYVPKVSFWATSIRRCHVFLLLIRVRTSVPRYPEPLMPVMAGTLGNMALDWGNTDWQWLLGRAARGLPTAQFVPRRWHRPAQAGHGELFGRFGQTRLPWHRQEAADHGWLFGASGPWRQDKPQSGHFLGHLFLHTFGHLWSTELWADIVAKF